MSARIDQGAGRPDTKMSRNDGPVKRARFGTGSTAHKRVQTQANKKRRQRDHTSASLSNWAGDSLE